MKIKGITIQLTLLIVFSISSAIYADSIHLTEGSILTGKVVRNQRLYYIFANTHGTFQVKKKYIKKLYRTKSYEQDINIHRSLGKNPDVKKVRLDYEAGVIKKNKLQGMLANDGDDGGKSTPVKDDKPVDQTEKKKGPWTYGRITFSMAYFNTFLSELQSTKDVNQVLPSGIGVNLTYDQGLEFKKQHMMIPGITIEHSFIYFTRSLFVNDSREVIGHGAYVGLMWALPGLNSKWGYFTLNVLPGFGFININNRDSNESASTVTFALKAAFGYEIQYKKVTFKFNFNYTYLIDINVAFHGIGGSFGLAFKLW